MGSTVAITLRSSIIAALGVSGTAAAQDAANSAAPNVEEIVVTGSSLRGVAPVGSNLVTIGRDDIENTGAQTVQQILKTVPSIVGLQSAGQAAYGSFDGAGTNAPTIHGLGASASNSTLILLNGHRMPVSGINHVLADPNIVAPLALERVEVLADGASSVYGSDAVAGVVNFITRRNVDGFEASLQTGAARRIRDGQRRGARRNDLGRRLAARLLQLFRSRQPRSRRPRLRAREPNGARRPRLHAEPLRSREHHRRNGADLLHAVHGARASSPATAIRRCTRISSPARLVTASSRRFSKTSAIA